MGAALHMGRARLHCCLKRRLEVTAAVVVPSVVCALRELRDLAVAGSINCSNAVKRTGLSHQLTHVRQHVGWDVSCVCIVQCAGHEAGRVDEEAVSSLLIPLPAAPTAGWDNIGWICLGWQSCPRCCKVVVGCRGHVCGIAAFPGTRNRESQRQPNCCKYRNIQQRAKRCLATAQFSLRPLLRYLQAMRWPRCCVVHLDFKLAVSRQYLQ